MLIIFHLSVYRGGVLCWLGCVSFAAFSFSATSQEFEFCTKIELAGLAAAPEYGG